MVQYISLLNMNNIKFSPYLFLRTPAISHADYNTLDEIIKTNFFQLAILFASENLYTELKKNDFDYTRLDKKIKFTLQKYFNRMCHRPTPFGVFSAFTSLNWASLPNNEPCVLGDSAIYINPDFQLLIDLGRKIEASGKYPIKYYSNNSIYKIKNEKRYLTVSYDKQISKSTFLIASFKPDRLLNKIITFCKNGKTKNEITLWLTNLIGTDEGVYDYLSDLITEGLLVSEVCPNITGDKYFDRLINIVCSNNVGEDKLVNLIFSYKNLADIAKQPSNINAKDLINTFLGNNGLKNIKSAFYVGYEKNSSSQLSLKYQNDIKDALFCLDRLTPSSQSKSLNNFKNKFRAKFEDQEIPLLQALDREAGIGYEGLEANLFNSELLDGIQLDLYSNSINFNWTPVHEYFLTKLSGKNDDCIVISNHDIEKIQPQSNLNIPPSFSVIFRIYNNKIWIEQAGGCTATSLLGRFTQFNNKVLDETLSINNQESELNKDIIFAEVSCFNDEHAANIITNAGVRNYEIPIGVHSTLNRRNIISLSDITISLIGDDIILKSKKLNKVIIPRLSSAYNYSRSDLSIYRFLCDLQYQGIKYNYNFDLKTLLPGLNFYPRIEYKNCILFPATWILTSEEINELCAKGDSYSNFNKLAQKLSLKQQFALTEGDNQLVFDRDNPLTIAIFINAIKNKNSAVLQEAFIDDNATIHDSGGKPFIGQFIASAISNSTTYPPPILTPVNRKVQTTKRIYLPGDEWLYFKLYCHPSIANNILVKHIRPIINNLKNKCILKSWYFIRYNDIDNHLRVRVQINKNNTAEVIQYFEKRFRNHVQKGSLNNLLVDTYKREIERYGASTITYVEKIFEASSDVIINYLKNITASIDNYAELHLALISINLIMDIFFNNNADKIILLTLIHENMKHEFEDSKQVKIQMDNKYREYSAFINNMEIYEPRIIKIIGKKEFNGFSTSINCLQQNTSHLSKQQFNKLIADVMHMHLNRIFNEKQRKQEFIIYYLLNKYYSSLKARQSKIASMLTPAPDSFGVNNIEKGILK